VLYFVKEKACFLAQGIFFFTILGCHSNGYHPKEALVKSNYKQDMKVLYSKNPFYNINLTIWWIHSISSTAKNSNQRTIEWLRQDYQDSLISKARDMGSGSVLLQFADLYFSQSSKAQEALTPRMPLRHTGFSCIMKCLDPWQCKQA